MYIGKNPKAVTSQDMLSEALLELLKESKMSSINIKTLCEKALVSRQTFYAMFSSKEEIIEYTMKKYLEDFNLSVLEDADVNIASISNNFVQWIIDYKSFMRILVNNDLMHLFMRQIKNNIKFLHVNLKREPHNKDAREINYSHTFLAGALSATVENFFSSEEPIDRENLSGLITEICTGKFFSHTFSPME